MCIRDSLRTGQYTAPNWPIKAKNAE